MPGVWEAGDRDGVLRARLLNGPRAYRDAGLPA